MKIPQQLEPLLDVLADPADGRTALTLENLGTNCGLTGAGGRTFAVDHGIPDMVCTDLEPTSHYPEHDDNWRRWQQLQTKVFSEFTYSGGITGWIQNLGHRQVARMAPTRPAWVLEIGSGVSHHFATHSSSYQGCRYINLDPSKRHLVAAQRKIAAPDLFFVRGSAYNLPFRSSSVDHVIAIYVFEHLYHLDDALAEVRRVLAPGGTWCLALPTEGGLAWTLGRKLTFSRTIRARYNVDYDHIMRFEHCNSCRQVRAAVTKTMTLTRATYLPFRFPTINLNAVLALSGTVEP